jgi:excisionase family DNA binding protein
MGLPNKSAAERDDGLVGYVVAGEILGLSPAKVARLVASGELEHVRIGSSVRFRRDALDRFIDSLTVGAEVKQ